MCGRMMRKGARFPVLPSRSGPKTGVARELVDELERTDVKFLAPVCDVSSLSAVQELLGSCAELMLSITDYINAAMILRVSSDSPSSNYPNSFYRTLSWTT